MHLQSSNLRQLKFSRKLPDPELQSLSAMMKDRMNEKEKLKSRKQLLDKGQKERWNEIVNNKDMVDVEDMAITDEMVAKGSALASWKIRQRQYAKKYGLGYDVVENCSTLVLMPMFMVLFQMIGISDPLIGSLLSQSQFWSSNDWIIKLGVSYGVAAYLNRFMAILIFRGYCLPKYYDKFGPM